MWLVPYMIEFGQLRDSNTRNQNASVPPPPDDLPPPSPIAIISNNLAPSPLSRGYQMNPSTEQISPLDASRSISFLEFEIDKIFASIELSLSCLNGNDITDSIKDLELVDDNVCSGCLIDCLDFCLCGRNSNKVVCQRHQRAKVCACLWISSKNQKNTAFAGCYSKTIDFCTNAHSRRTVDHHHRKHFPAIRESHMEKRENLLHVPSSCNHPHCRLNCPRLCIVR